MEDKLRRHIDDIFEATTPSKKSVELKEEMIRNLTDKYNDLLSQGKTNEAAYNIAVAGIGDVSGLLEELEEDAMNDPKYTKEMEQAQRKSAMLTSVAVMLYILSVLPLVIIEIWVSAERAEMFGLPLFFIMVAVATGLLIYNNMTKPSAIRKSNDTMVEDFREWNSDKKARKRMRRAISSALWALVTLVYLVVSFLTFAWHITWIIFVIGVAIEAIMNIFYAASDK